MMHFVRRVLDFCRDHRTELHAEQQNIERLGGIRYPITKPVDLYFRQTGYDRADRQNATKTLWLLESIPAPQRVFRGGAEARQIGLDDVEQPILADGVVFMPQHVAERADILPRLIGHQVHGHIAEFGGGLADALQAALDRVIDEAVFVERVQVHTLGVA